MNLRKITELEFNYFLEKSIEDYAIQKTKAGNYDKEEATYKATEEFEKLLPNGMDTHDNYIYSLIDDNHTVGSIWIGKKSESIGYIYQIYVFEEFQGKGYGKFMMREIENIAKNLGLSKLQLHVLGHNEKAINLYKSFNYITTNIIMNKDL